MIVYRFASCQTGDVDILALQLTKKERSQVNVNDDFLHSVLPLANFLFFLVSSFSVEKDCQSCWITAAATFGDYESPEFGHKILYEISANMAKYSEGHLSLTSKTIFDITAYWPGFQVVVYVISVQHPA